MNQTTVRLSRLLIPALAILLIFGIILITINGDGPWVDELWSLWAVRTATFGGMLDHIIHDYHPPLYFILLYGWVPLTGDSTFAMRLLSGLIGLAGAAATYALGKRLFDRPTAVIAMLLLGSAGFFRNYAAEVRMYSLLLTTSALCMLAFVRWLDRPTAARGALYGVALTATVGTQYHGGWIVVAQGLYLLLFRRDRWLRWTLPLAVAAGLFAPWLPVLRAQIAQRPVLLVAAAAPTDRATVNWVVSLVSSGLGAAFLIPYALRPDWGRLRRCARPLALMASWLVGVPATVLVLNLWGHFFYHPRYLIGILPAGALIAGFGLRTARWKTLAAGSLAALLILPLIHYRDLWPSRSAGYENPLLAVAGHMAPGDARILDLDPDNLVSYYDRVEKLGLRQNVTLDLTGVTSERAALMDRVAGLSGRDPLWLILPSNVPRSWALFAALGKTDHASYAESVQNMVFYRFAPGQPRPLDFRFGELVGYQGELRADQAIRVAQGKPICVGLSLRALAPLDGQYSAAVHAVDAAGSSLAQWDGGLDAHQTGDLIAIKPCLGGSENLPPGEATLLLTVYNWSTLGRLPIWEDSTGKPVAWGDTLVLAEAAITAR